MYGLNAICAGTTQRLVTEVSKLSYEFTGVLIDAETVIQLSSYTVISCSCFQYSNKQHTLYTTHGKHK